jgi:hypothetical protein
LPPFLAVKRETDLVALAAFILAFAAVACQVTTCTVGINDALIVQLKTAPDKWGAPACEEALSSL